LAPQDDNFGDFFRNCQGAEVIFHPDISALIEDNLPTIFLIYGFSFFYVALAILFSMKTLRSIGLFGAFVFLFLFSVIHGSVEWLDTYRQFSIQLYGADVSERVLYLRSYMLSSSFVFMLLFGMTLFSKVAGSIRLARLSTVIGITLVVFFAVLFKLSADDSLDKIEAFSRVLLGFPSAAFAGAAFYMLSRKDYDTFLPEHHSWYFRYSCYIIVLYGVFSGLVVPKTQFLFADIINQRSFFEYTGLPVQVLRAFCAVAISYFMIRAMALKISQRLMGILGTFFLLFFIFGMTGYINLKLVINSYETITKLKAEESQFSDLAASFDRIYALQGVKGDREARILLDEQLSVFGTALEKTRALRHTDPRENALIEDLARFYDEAIAARSDFRISRAGMEKFKSAIGEVRLLHSSEIGEQSALVAKIIENSLYLRFMVLAVSVGAFLFIWYSIHRTIIQPIRNLRAGATQLAGGNLQYRISIKTADDLQELADDFNVMREKLLERTEKLATTAREMEELSTHDGLTGLYNYRYFHNRLKEEMQKSARAGAPLSVMLMDLDNFKLYNDRHGHPAGDLLLKTAAEIFRQTLRGTDLICRYGGEEFVAILPNTGKEGAIVAAENVRANMEGHDFPHRETQPLGAVTITIGVAQYPEDATSADELVKCADDLMYKAKKEGKNKVYAVTCSAVKAQIV